jgi:hypothetical protein
LAQIRLILSIAPVEPGRHMGPLSHPGPCAADRRGDVHAGAGAAASAGKPARWAVAEWARVPPDAPPVRVQECGVLLGLWPPDGGQHSSEGLSSRVSIACVDPAIARLACRPDISSAPPWVSRATSKCSLRVEANKVQDVAVRQIDLCTVGSALDQSGQCGRGQRRGDSRQPPGSASLPCLAAKWIPRPTRC